MAKSDALKRLGGGRWETRDGRFTIEPQSGTWVIVDSTQTNDFGLPLVRGPFGSLTAAREAIEAAREEEPLRSPLADRIEKARLEKPPVARSKAGARGKGAPSPGVKPAPDPRPAPDPEPEPEPEPATRPEPEPGTPPEPGWLADLSRADQRKAIGLADRLETAGIEDHWAIVRRELVDGQPALARLALRRRLASVGGAGGRRTLIDDVVVLLLAGADDDLGVEWQLVDGQGRPIRDLDPGDED